MFRRFYAFLAVCLSLLAFPAAAYTPTADTFLYKISKSGRPDSYLIGTIHIGRTGERLPVAYRRALQRTAQVVVESDADALSAEQERRIAAMLHSPVPLKQSVGSDKMQTLRRITRHQQQLSAINGDTTLKPWALLLSLQTLYQPDGFSLDHGIDHLLIRAAKSQGKSVIALETQEPLAYFAALPEDAVQRAIDSFIRHHRNFAADTRQLAADYHQGRTRKIWAEISNPQHELRYLPKQDHAVWEKLLYAQLLTERNQNWLPKIATHLAERPTLIAVGAAHLFGKQGMIHRLRQAGYTVEPVLK